MIRGFMWLLSLLETAFYLMFDPPTHRGLQKINLEHQWTEPFHNSINKMCADSTTPSALHERIW